MTQIVGFQEGRITAGRVDGEISLAAAIEATALISVRVGEQNVVEVIDSDIAQMILPGAGTEVDGDSPISIAQEVDIAGIGVEKKIGRKLFPELFRSHELFLHEGELFPDKNDTSDDTDCGEEEQGTDERLTAF